jgi:putative transposase
MTGQEQESKHPKRQPLRLPNYDYTSAGAYFVTICADQHKPLFDHPELTRFLLETWQSLPDRFPGVTLDEFVIMPNHVHFILWLDGPGEHANVLGRVVGAYKSLTSVTWLNYHKSMGTRCSQHLWQRGYYEHVIRNEQDLDLKRRYIMNNPAKELEKSP